MEGPDSTRPQATVRDHSSSRELELDTYPTCDINPFSGNVLPFQDDFCSKLT